MKTFRFLRGILAVLLFPVAIFGALGIGRSDNYDEQ